MPLYNCTICQGPIRPTTGCINCTTWHVHSRCCTQHPCISCAGTFNFLHTCRSCPDCCRCFAGRCVECRSGVNRVCVVCSNCTTHCRCSSTVSINTLRRTASQVRWEQARHAATEMRVLERNVGRSRQEHAIFIPAGRGDGKKIEAPRLGKTALTHIYGEGAWTQGTNQEGKKVPLLTSLPNQFKENTSRRFLCPEIEVASGNREMAMEAAVLWGGQVVRDGSLPPTGFEINLSPTQGDLYTKMVSDICGILASSGAAVNSTCGLHVHVDARDLDYMDIRKVVLLYELIEPALFSCLPIARHEGRFCIPCGHLYAGHIREGLALDLKTVIEDKKKKKIDLKAPVVEMVYGKGVKRPSNNHGKYGSGATHDVRYRAMNLYSWYYRGSIEFRQSPGSIDPQYITDWSLICAGLIDTAKKISEKELGRIWPAGSKYAAEHSSLYNGVFHKESKTLLKTVTASSLLEGSTKLLSDCVQPRCHSLIKELQGKYKRTVKPKEQRGSGSVSYAANNIAAHYTSFVGDDFLD